MGDAELMTIGRFARLTGLSIHTLRHYDDVSLLIPAQTDPQTGYRRCGRDQIRLAHLIRELRWIGLPIEEVQQVLAETGQAGPVLDSHRQRLLRTRGLLTAQIDNVDRLLEEGFTIRSHRGRRTARPAGHASQCGRQRSQRQLDLALPGLTSRTHARAAWTV